MPTKKTRKSFIFPQYLIDAAKMAYPGVSITYALQCAVADRLNIERPLLPKDRMRDGPMKPDSQVTEYALKQRKYRAGVKKRQEGQL